LSKIYKIIKQTNLKLINQIILFNYRSINYSFKWKAK
jgi:hypothetical protein